MIRNGLKKKMESQLNYYLGQDDVTEKELEATFFKRV